MTWRAYALAACNFFQNISYYRSTVKMGCLMYPGHMTGVVDLLCARRISFVAAS